MALPQRDIRTTFDSKEGSRILLKFEKVEIDGKVLFTRLSHITLSPKTLIQRYLK